ncbi:MAG TPA: helix-turn-helix transcriptional regulator [Casimicrobiaceae bacterium]
MPMAISTEALAPRAALAGLPAQDAMLLASIGKRVREARERRGMARKTLSQHSNVSERYLAHLEAGQANVSVLLLRNVARALEMPLTELIDPQESSVEQRLIRRFLDKLPSRQLEDVVFRLMRDFGPEAAARKRRLALVGLRGAGKTTLGSALAKELRLPFIELDREIERDAGISLSEIFSLYGQTGYRRIERRCLERLIQGNKQVVIAVGGGIVSEPETYNLLLASCFTVWIKASPAEHMARVVAQGDLRPMQGSAEAMEDLNRILAVREPLYRKADVTLDTAGERAEQSLAKLRQAVPA